MWIEGSGDKDAHYFFCYAKPNDVVGIYCSSENSIFEIDRDFAIKYVEQFDTFGYEKAIVGKNNVIGEGKIYNLATLLLSMMEEC